jgi:hypothetical protein
MKKQNKKNNQIIQIAKGLFFSEDFAKMTNCIIYIKKGFIMNLSTTQHNKNKKSSGSANKKIKTQHK